jgi:hypothetical protein
MVCPHYIADACLCKHQMTQKMEQKEFTNADSKVVFTMSSYAIDCLLNDSVYRREAVTALSVSPGGCKCSPGLPPAITLNCYERA